MSLAIRVLIGLVLGLAAGIAIAVADVPALGAAAAAIEPLGALWVNAIRRPWSCRRARTCGAVLPRHRGRTPIYIAFGPPVEGIGLLIAVDIIVDTFITAANVTANMTVATLLARRA